MTPSINDIIQTSKLLRQTSSDTWVANGGRRRGSLPSPPLAPLIIKDHGCDLIAEENNNEEKTQLDLDEDDFIDEEEDEILVLFEEGENCDNSQESDEEENIWSPSPLPEDIKADESKEQDTNSKSSTSFALHAPILEEENGKINVTEQFMRDLIRYE